MKIGIDCRMYSTAYTGIGRYVYELVTRLAKLDHENHYVLFFNEPEFSEFKEPNKRIKKVLANAPYYSRQEQTRFANTLQKENLDLMHFTHFNAPFLYNKPFIVTIHDLTLSFFPGKKMNSLFHRIGYHLVLKHAIKKAKKVIAVSYNTQKDIHKLFRLPSSRVEVIYEGVSENFKPLPNPPLHLQKITKKYDLKTPYILYTGVWRSHKNVINLLRAFALLKKDYQFEGYLVITGNHDPAYAPEVFQQATNLQIINDVIFPGMVAEEDLMTLYNGALAYVFPSLYEGFGLPPLEAMQCGIPVAVSNTSCLPEICGAENALFFDPRKPEDMAEKINELMINKELRQKLIHNGLEHIKKFSWQKMAEETLKMYNDTLNKK